ncbi:MAG: dTMP kinase [Candidatus Omnitrophota bacterium]|nr:dTMP kinase [Candidatus Omnitrophota bacterium]
MKQGRMITFEGGEGSGKSTQIRRAAAYLRKRGHRVLLLREPGGTRVSEAIRKVVMSKRFRDMTPETELLLYLAARAQIVQEKILPALRKGTIVICDRFEDSTIAYQGFARKLSRDGILETSRRWVRGSLKPYLTFLLDLPPKEGLKRSGRRDRIETESLSFHEKVRRGFLTLARQERRRFLVLDASRKRAEVARQIRKRLERVF